MIFILKGLFQMQVWLDDVTLVNLIFANVCMIVTCCYICVMHNYVKVT